MKKFIAGVDESGRGSLVGPVVSAAVILYSKHNISGLTDSKKLSSKKRATLYKEIIRKSQSYSIALASAEEIDQMNILQATMLSMSRAVKNLSVIPSYVLVDGTQLPNWKYESKAIIKGDLKVQSISAASILAKEFRDNIMIKLDKIYPKYGFFRHKGYATKFHIQQIKKYGFTKDHRKTFNPISRML